MLSPVLTDADLAAGATVVRVGAVEVLLGQTARALLYHLVQSVAVAVVLVVAFTAPAVLPLGVCAVVSPSRGLGSDGSRLFAGRRRPRRCRLGADRAFAGCLIGIAGL